MRENSDAPFAFAHSKPIRFDVVEAKKLESKLNQTQEREVDSVYEITDKSGKNGLILHLEFQNTNDDRDALSYGELSCFIAPKI